MGNTYRNARINPSTAKQVVENVMCGVILSGCGICLPKNLSAWLAQKKEGFFVVRLRRTPQNDTTLVFGLCGK